MVATRPAELNRKQRKALAWQLRVDDPGLDVMHPHAAGIDIGNSAHMSRSGRIEIPTRSAGLSVSPPTYIAWRTGWCTAE
jgi:hypothetical protein